MLEEDIDQLAPEDSPEPTRNNIRKAFHQEKEQRKASQHENAVLKNQVRILERQRELRRYIACEDSCM